MFRIHQIANMTYISVHGNIDLENASHLNKLLNKIMNTGKYRVALDFSNVDYITSAGIGVLIYSHKKMEQNMGRLVLRGLKEDIHRVFKLLGFHDFFHIAA